MNEVLIGKKFGSWTVIKDLGMIPGKTRAYHFVLCKCKCGNNSKVTIENLKNGTSNQCELCRKKNLNKINLTHGLRYHALYNTWNLIIQRCTNPQNSNYKNYGARGITVCKRWIESFENFLNDMGEKPSKKHSIDRKDNEGNYTPDNCVWATKKEQANNRRNSKKVKI